MNGVMLRLVESYWDRKTMAFAISLSRTAKNCHPECRDTQAMLHSIIGYLIVVH
jgi:hypothetical protein